MILCSPFPVHGHGRKRSQQRSSSTLFFVSRSTPLFSCQVSPPPVPRCQSNHASAGVEYGDCTPSSVPQCRQDNIYFVDGAPAIPLLTAQCVIMWMSIVGKAKQYSPRHSPYWLHYTGQNCTLMQCPKVKNSAQHTPCSRIFNVRGTNTQTPS